MNRIAALATTARTLRDLGWSQLTDALAARTGTSRGADKARALPFLLDRASVEGSLALIEEARALLRRQLPMPVSGVEDIRPLVERTQKGAVLQAHELMDCANVARAGANARRFVTGLAEDVPLLATMVQGFHNLADLAARVTRTFEPSGALRDDASAELAEYRRRARQLHERLKSRLEGHLAEPDFAHYLQDNYYSLRNDRYVVPVKSSFRVKVPGIVHNASQSGQTIFVEIDELVPLGNELTIAESLADEEERRVLFELSREVASLATPLLANAELLAQLDLVQAAARLSNDLDSEVPILVDPDAPFCLERARHPLLLVQGKRVVANTIVLAARERALIISGPNAGGKTVSMATVGLCFLMARAGLPIPAAVTSRVPLVSGLTCAIGDAQDLARDLSSFSAHLEALSEILGTAGRGWLCLIDEIASDTDPVEGAALATAILEALTDRGARVLVTTHLEEVKAFAVKDPRFVNARVGMDPETLRPNYVVELGVAGVSKAIEVAAQVGLPPEVIDRARQNLKGGGALTLALEALEQEQQEVRQERDALAAQLRVTEAEAERLRVATEEAERARGEAEITLRREMVAIYAEAGKEAAAAVAALQAGASMQRAQAIQRAMRDKLAEHRRALADLDGRSVNGSADGGAEVGDRVRVPGWGQIGEVLGVDGDEATVAVGSLRTRVPVVSLVRVPRRKPTGGGRPPRRASREQAQRAESPGAELTEALIPEAATLDLRGERADDACRALESFLDQALLANRTPLLVIHGHGTGALRQVVREALSSSDYVEAHRPGDEHEGGDGVTIVRLRV